MTQHGMQEDEAFVGPTPKQFELATTWAGVDKGYLRWASSVHWPAQSRIVWFVRDCVDLWTTMGLGATSYGAYEPWRRRHNNLAIVWDYGADTPGGILHIHDILIDHGFLFPVEGSEQDHPWGAFPCAFVGPLYEGQHGDGVDSLIYLTPLTVTAKNIADKFHDGATYPGLSITIDATPFTITGDGWLGSIAYVRKGYTGDMTVEKCMWQKGLIVNHSGGTLDIWTPMALDDTSSLWIGGFNWVVDTGAIDRGDPDSKKNLKRVDAQVRPQG